MRILNALIAAVLFTTTTASSAPCLAPIREAEKQNPATTDSESTILFIYEPPSTFNPSSGGSNSARGQKTSVRFLEIAGYEVVTSMEELDGKIPKVAILDIATAANTSPRDIYPGIPIIVLDSFVIHPDDSPLNDVQSDECLTLPFPPSKLLETVKRFCPPSITAQILPPPTEDQIYPSLLSEPSEPKQSATAVTASL